MTAPTALLPENLRFPIDTEQHLVLDSSRIRDELSYTEGVPLQEALTRTIEWERANPPPEVGAVDDVAEDRVLAKL